MHQLNHSNSVLMKTAVSERPHSTFCSWPLVFLLKKKHSHIFQLISQLCYIIFSLHFFLFITVCQLQYTQFNFFFKNFYKSYMLKSVILLDLWLLSVTHTHTFSIPLFLTSEPSSHIWEYYVIHPGTWLWHPLPRHHLFCSSWSLRV